MHTFWYDRSKFHHQMSQQVSIHFIGTSIFQSNMRRVVIASARTIVDSHYILNAWENGMMHRSTQLEGVPTPSSLAWNPHFTFWPPSVSIAPPYVRHPEMRIPLLPHHYQTQPLQEVRGHSIQSRPHGGNMYRRAAGPRRNSMASPQHNVICYFLFPL